MPGLHQLLADVLVLVARVRGAGSHDETGAAPVVQVAVEVLNPQAVGVRNRIAIAFVLALGFSGNTGQAKGHPRVQLPH